MADAAVADDDTKVLNGTEGGVNSALESVADSDASPRTKTIDFAMDQITKNHASLHELSMGLERQNADLVRASQASSDTAKARGQALKPPQIPDDANKPFQYNQPPTSPLESFGSLASAFGLMASLLTKTPLTSALNAAGSAMQAAKQGDIDAYNASFAAWKAHTDMALKQYDLESKSYHDAMELIGKDDTTAQARIRTMATLSNNQYMRAATEAGRFDLAMEYLTKMDGLANKVRNLKFDPLETLYMQMRKDDPEGNPVDQLLGAQKKLSDAKAKESDGSKQSPSTQVFDARVKEYKGQHDGQEPPADMKQKWLSEIQFQQGATKNALPTPADSARMRASEDQIIITQAKIDSAIDDVNKTIASVGFKGRIGKAAETVGNILGLTDDATRHVLQSKLDDIALEASTTLKGWAVSSRIPVAMQKVVRDIVGGRLDPGTTWQNTVAGLKYVKKALEAQKAASEAERHGDTISPFAAKRLVGPDDNSGGGGSGGNPWDSDPAVGGQ